MNHDGRLPARILVTGGGGMLGRSLAASLDGADADITYATREDADLRDRGAVRDLFAAVRPELVVHCAARVGGIAANAADQTGHLLENTAIDSSVFGVALEHGVERFVYMSSSCTYPRDHRQPLVEGDLLQGELEPTNEGYALAKLAGTRLCRYVSAERGWSYRALVASNLYGPGDDASAERGHLVAAALAKVHRAHRAGDEEVVVWGDGTARREFTYAPDLAGWMASVLPRLEDLPPVLNAGAGVDHSVDDYYRAAAAVVGYRGRFVHDLTAPAGMHQKLMDSTPARRLGWEPGTTLEDGMRATHLDLLERGVAA